MILKGTCPKCGHEETRDTGEPEQWLINRPIWTWCHGIGYGGHLSGQYTNAKECCLECRKMKPCDKCSTNIEQAIMFDEITCYLTCKKWKRWSKKTKC